MQVYVQCKLNLHFRQMNIEHYKGYSDFKSRYVSTQDGGHAARQQDSEQPLRVVSAATLQGIAYTLVRDLFGWP
jgi:hypothetical protein